MNTVLAPSPVGEASTTPETVLQIVSTTTGSFLSSRFTRRGRTLADVMSYDNPDVVARLAREETLSLEEARSLFRDTILFLWLGSQVKGSLAPTPRIDLGWHAFLLFTQDYRVFCHEYFGHFIDHHPRRLTDVRDNGETVRNSRDHAQHVLIEEHGLTLSRNWVYTVLEQAEKDCCGEGNCGSGKAEAAAKCCGNCGSDCCKR